MSFFKPHLDSRTALLMIVLINILYFLGGSYLFVSIASIYAISLFFILGKIKAGINAVIMFIIAELIRQLGELLPQKVQVITGTVLIPLLMFYPFFLYAILFASTINISETISSFKKWKTPNAILVPLVVMVRFFPTLSEELRNTRASMTLRGRGGSVFQKIMNIYVPILFSSVRSGETLTMAAMTKGLGLYKTSTIVRDCKFCFVDYLSFAVLIGLIIASIISKVGGVA